MLNINDNIDDDIDRLNARLELFFEEFQCNFDDFDCTHLSSNMTRRYSYKIARFKV